MSASAASAKKAKKAKKAKQKRVRNSSPRGRREAARMDAAVAVRREVRS